MNEIDIGAITVEVLFFVLVSLGLVAIVINTVLGWHDDMKREPHDHYRD